MLSCYIAPPRRVRKLLTDSTSERLFSRPDLSRLVGKAIMCKEALVYTNMCLVGTLFACCFRQTEVLLSCGCSLNKVWFLFCVWVFTVIPFYPGTVLFYRFQLVGTDYAQ